MENEPLPTEVVQIINLPVNAMKLLARTISFISDG